MLQALILSYLAYTTLEDITNDREMAIIAANNPEQPCLFCNKVQKKVNMTKIEANEGEIYWFCNPLCDQGRCID